MPGSSNPFGAAHFPWRKFALVWTAIAAMLVLSGAGRIPRHQFFDPDDYLRLVQVRDLLAGQHWFDLTQYRLNPPHGTPMHWSRLVDLPLAAIILLLSPLLGVHGAETAAIVIVPIVTIGCVIALAMRIASRFFDTETTVLAGLSVTLVTATLAQLQPLRIDHHGWQIAMVMLAAASPLLVASERRAGALAGLAMAIGLAISLEVLPQVAVYAGVLALGWLVTPANGQRFAAYTGTLAAALAGLFLATRGPAALTPWCDAIAPAHLALFATAAAGAALAAWFGPAKRWFVLVALGFSGAAALVVFAMMAPNCLAAPFSELDPVVLKLWYKNIPEGMPIWNQPLNVALVSGVPVVLALLAMARLYQRSSGAARRFWGEYFLFFAAAAMIGMFMWRSTGFAGALGAVPLGWLIAQAMVWVRKDRTASAEGRLPLRYISVAAIIAALGLLVSFAGGQTKPATKLAQGPAECGLPGSAELLDKLPAQTIFVPLDISTILLERSHHSVVASNHHRANLAIRDVMQGFMASPDQARSTLARHGASLVVVCTDVTEPDNYARMAPQGLMAQLLAGRPPTWLERVQIGAPANLLVYRVISQP